MPKQQLKDAIGSESPRLTGELSKFQAFTIETIHRSEWKNAPYNPRHLTQRARVKLREVIQRVGLVQPLVWNKRSGNGVGGHQRISQIDSLEGKDDYKLTVAVVDVDDKREKELNVLLNNADVGGEWDLEKLKAVFDSEIDLLNTGFDNAEFFKLFGEAPSQPKEEHQGDLSKQLADVKAAYEKLSESSRQKDDTDFYNVVVFGSVNERDEFLKEFGFETNRYIDGRTLVEVFRSVKKSELSRAGEKVTGLCIAKDKAKPAKKPL